MKSAGLDAILEALGERRPVVRLAWIGTDREQIVDPHAAQSGDGASDLSADLWEAVAESVRSDRARLVSDAGAEVFIHPFNPPIRIAIIGAVHIAQRLCVLAGELGHAVIMIDPRQEFLTESRFPDVMRSHLWPDKALDDLGLDARTAVVTLSHDAKIDEPALEAALASDAFYIGALGSKRTQGKRRARLLDAGVAESALERIHGPVGLDLGAQGPAEIALSIAAEITATLRAR